MRKTTSGKDATHLRKYNRKESMGVKDKDFHDNNRSNSRELGNDVHLWQKGLLQLEGISKGLSIGFFLVRVRVRTGSIH